MVVSGAETCTPETCLKSKRKLRDLLTPQWQQSCHSLEDSHPLHLYQHTLL